MPDVLADGRMHALHDRKDMNAMAHIRHDEETGADILLLCKTLICEKEVQPSLSSPRCRCIDCRVAAGGITVAEELLRARMTFAELLNKSTIVRDLLQLARCKEMTGRFCAARAGKTSGCQCDACKAWRRLAKKREACK